jgi:hypothetical protein
MIEWSICIAYLSGVPSEIGSKVMWLIIDISFVLDGWSHARNPGRLPGRSGQRFSTTATTTSKSSRGYGSVDRTSQFVGTSTTEPTTPAITRRS